MSRVAVVEQIDPEADVASGIDTIIRDFIAYADPDDVFEIVGVSAKRKIGEWCTVVVAGKPTRFLPVARVDKSAKESALRRRIPHSLRLAFGVLRYQRRLGASSYDVVHAHRLELGLLTMRLLRRPTVQFVHNAHANLTGSSSDSAWSRLAKFYAWIEKRVVVSAARVGVFNRRETLRLREVRPDVVRCRTWFDPELFGLADRTFQGGPVIVWVGRMDAQKDPMLALDVLEQVLLHSASAVLHMVGGGVDAGDVLRRSRSLPAGSVILHGSQSRAMVAQLMSQSSVFLMTSHYEGSPTVLVEAASSGLPAVVTRGSDPDEVIIEGRTGFRTGRDPKEIAKSLIEAAAFDPRDCARSVQERATPEFPKALLRELHRGL